VLLNKYDLNGNVVWIHQLKSDFVQVAGIVADESGSIYALGNFVGWLSIEDDSIHVDGDPILLDAELFMVKIDPQGQVVWLRHVGGGVDHNGAESLAYSGGMLFGCGQFRAEMQLGSVNMTSSSFKNGFLFAMDTLGDIAWSRQFMSSNAHPLAVKAQSNRVVVSGLFQSSMSVQSESLSGVGGPGDGFVVAFDISGNISGMKAIGGVGTDELNHVEIVGDSLILFAGISNSASFDVDGLSFQNAANEPGGFNHNQFAVILDSDLTARCIYATTSTNSGLGIETNFNHIGADSIWIVSGFWEEFEIDGIGLTSDGGSTFIARTCMNCPELIRLNAGEIPTHNKPFLSVYPNPNDGNFTVNYALPDGVAANLYLITTSGQKMLLSQNIRSSGNEVFNISGPSGVYHLVLEGSDSKSLRTVKIVVSR